MIMKREGGAPDGGEGLDDGRVAEGLEDALAVDDELDDVHEPGPEG